MSLTDEKTADLTTTICDDREASEVVIAAVADAKGVDPLDMDPLFNAVDPDALDTLFCSENRPSLSGLKLSFSIDGCHVVVRGEEVAVTLPEETCDASTTFARLRT